MDMGSSCTPDRNPQSILSRPPIRMSRAAIPHTLAAIFLALTACEFETFGVDDQDGAIQVIVVRGPLHPVDQPGQLNEEPVQGALVMARPAFGDVTRSTSTNAFGVAHFRVAAGTWRLAVQNCPGALGTPIDQTVQVTPGGFATARFECDTGIR
jgi:hypothetical protein